MADTREPGRGRAHWCGTCATGSAGRTAPAWATDATPSSDTWAAGTTTPVRLVVGDRDPEAAHARSLADRLGAALHEVPGAGHLLPVERPSEVARLIG